MDHFPQSFVVLNQKDSFPLAGFSALRNTHFSGNVFSLNSWQVYVECCTYTGLTAHLNNSVALLYDTVYHGKAQAAALFADFGGIEGFEDTRLSVCVHSASRIADGYLYVLTGLKIGIDYQ